jgi:hypothetical protein
VPIRNGVVCIRPEPACWHSLLHENRRAMDNGAARDPSGRMELLNRAGAYTHRILQADGPDCSGTDIIGTGHQALWHHCGIWAKTLVASQFARGVQAGRLHIIVDHDVCDTALVMPVKTSKGHWTPRRVEIETCRRKVPLEMRESPPARRVEEFVRVVAESNPGATCADIWTRAALHETGDKCHFRTISDLITYLHALLDRHLGLADALYLPVSELSVSDAFVRFARSVMVDAPRFARIYNEAVGACSRAKGSHRRIARCLTIDAEAGHTEAPFWLTAPDGDRQPLYTSRQKKGMIGIVAADRELGVLDAARGDGPDQLRRLLERHLYLLRPRAVTLTLFLRMTLVDWFVHGVGGADYELIGDYLFERYYGRHPPHVAVATCTMTLPRDGSVSGANDVDVPAKHEWRALEHHPERYIPEPLVKQEPVATLIRRKQTAVSRANDRRLPHEQKKAAWREITKVNAELLPYALRAADALRQRLAEAENRARSEKVRTDREYFFGLFPEPRLRALKESVSEWAFLPGGRRPVEAGPVSVDHESDSAGPAPGRP